MRTIGETQSMGLEADGGVLGAGFQLTPTPEGYFGRAGSRWVDLSGEGRRIIGVLGNGLVNLHLRVDGEAVSVQGLFGGQLGRLAADRHGISSWLGGCYYDLQASGARFEGQRTCRRSRHVPEPVVVQLPDAFDRLPAERRAMLLALLLGA
jgi:hypothetical protein